MYKGIILWIYVTEFDHGAALWNKTMELQCGIISFDYITE